MDFYTLIKTNFFMAKPTKPADNSSNQQNKNKGQNATNIQYDKAQGNKGKQLNPNQTKPKK